jgi:hypothetical protein
LAEAELLLHSEDTENRKRKVAMKTLKLVLKKQWYDMIASGEKNEEYREITDHYKTLLCRKFKIDPALVDGHHHSCLYKKDCSYCMSRPDRPIFQRYYDGVTFYLGYATDRPEMTFKMKGIYIGEGKPEWGAEPGKKYFVIKLGDRL